MCFVSDNLGYSLCTFSLSREFPFPCLCPVDSCTSGFSGKEKSAEASSGRRCAPQLHVTIHGSCSFPQLGVGEVLGQCQVLGQWIIPLDPNEGRDGAKSTYRRDQIPVGVAREASRRRVMLKKVWKEGILGREGQSVRGWSCEGQWSVRVWERFVLFK